MSRELRFSRLRFSYQLIGKFGCMLHNLLLARNLFVLHQDFTITDNGIDTTAVCCIHEIGDKVMIRGKSRDIQIDQTEIRQIAFGNPSGFQSDSQSTGFCRRLEYFTGWNRLRVFPLGLA